MTQYARPDSDDDIGNWQSNSMGGDLYEAIDEASGGDDHITVMDDGMGSAEPASFTLSDVTDPADHTNHKVVVNAYMDDSEATSINLNINLKQGSTSLKNQDFTVAYSDGDGTDYTMVLASTDIDTELTNYNDLNLLITVTDTSAGGTISTYVNRAWFECPDVSAAVTTSPAFLIFVDC